MYKKSVGKLKFDLSEIDLSGGAIAPINDRFQRRVCKREPKQSLRFRGDPTTRCSIRKTVKGQLRFEPSVKHILLFLYCLGVSANAHNISLNALFILLNEYRLITSDYGSESDLSAFYQRFHSDLTRALKELHDEPGSIWEPGGPDERVILTVEDFKESFISGRVKPVRDGYVDSPTKWPGFSVSASDLGTMKLKIKRPDCLNKTRNRPDFVIVEFQLPPCVNEWVDSKCEEGGLTVSQAENDFRHMVGQAENAKVKEIRSAREQRGFGYLGTRCLNKVLPKWFMHDLERESKFRLRSVVVESDYSETFRKLHCIERQTFFIKYRQFIKDYKTALKEWLKDKSTVFPYGTYRMRKVFKVKCIE